MKRLTIAVLTSILSTVAMATANSPLETEGPKTLSEKEIKGYLMGRGMGFAKVAELNHYPGPSHVLELKGELSLTEAQVVQTQNIYEAMLHRASTLGKQLLKKEKEIEALFSSQQADPRTLENLLAQSSSIKAQIRLAHLRAHISQKEILSGQQIKKYDELRGYTNGTQGHNEHHH